MPRRRQFLLKTALAAAALSAPAAAGQGGQAAPSCPGPAGEAVAGGRLGAAGPHLLLDANFPDPFLARFGKSYYAYATGNQIGGAQMNVQLVRSASLTGWSRPVEAFPAANLPGWVDRRHPQVWAPEVMPVAGRYVLYFNARHATLTRTERSPEGERVLQRHCVGAAIADRPEGPFTGVGEPLACAGVPEGAIDAHVFADRGSLYLYYKHDANCCGGTSSIFVQGLSADGLAASGPAHRLIASDDEPGPHDDWEWKVVEAPTMIRRGRAYYLFYSGNFFGNKNYAVAYLSCAGPRGPCIDRRDNPILWSHPGSPLIGPGHQSLLRQGKRDYIFYHGWNRDPDGREQPGVHKRCLYVSRLAWQRDAASGEERPVIAGGKPEAPR